MASRATVLFKTKGGLSVFQLLCPKLVMVGGKNKANIDSPISEGKNCFSVFEWKGKYLFKDHHTKVHGDVFQFVALMHNLNSKSEFQKVLETIERILDASIATIPETETQSYFNSNTEDTLCLVSKLVSKPQVEKYFAEAMPYLSHMPTYMVQLVKSFRFEGKDIDYEFDYSQPSEAFYAIVIRPEQYYILFNPFKRITYEWGEMPEFYAVGQDHLFTTAYCKNIYLRESLIITNRVEGLLWCEDKEIPCLALLNNEMLLPEYVLEVIVSKFPYKYLMFHALGDDQKQFASFVSKYGFTVIKTVDSYLYQFFNRGDAATDKVLDDIHHCDGYEFVGLKNPVERYTETDLL